MVANDPTGSGSRRTLRLVPVLYHFEEAVTAVPNAHSLRSCLFFITNRCQVGIGLWNETHYGHIQHHYPRRFQHYPYPHTFQLCPPGSRETDELLGAGASQRCPLSASVRYWRGLLKLLIQESFPTGESSTRWEKSFTTYSARVNLDMFLRVPLNPFDEKWD